jgi:hypothetical protein
VLFLLALAAIDFAVARTLTPDAVYQQAYRLPRELPTASLADYVESIRASARSADGGPVILFLGASPTWGHRIEDPRDTYPAVYQAAAAADGWTTRTYNLASNGQFVGDGYLIASALAEESDVVFVQLTYHTFNPAARAGMPVRYPEIPRLLGLDLDEDTAKMMGAEPGDSKKTESRVDAILRERWLLWRERDALTRRLFGGVPRQVLADAVSGAEPSFTRLPDDGSEAPSQMSLDELPPAQALIALARYAENSAFTISPSDTEVVFLGRLARMFEERGTRAVFFMAPLNREAIEYYELIDPKQYESNTALLRGVVEGAGFPFVDPNVGDIVVPGDLFADINHTTGEGGRLFGAHLYESTRAYVRSGEGAL